ncbi:MAG TPA: Crp/Fnr family transcriptional regulator [Terriglobales bacterium]|jgi:CRP/FNR family transcriptional regulator|nr:Crp/Fnr family transcriptional regulator [Terriglobales bacterium]
MSSPYGLEFVESCLGCKLPGKEFFCYLPHASLPALEKVRFPNLLPKGSTLYVTHQKANGVYLICIGNVKVWTTGPDGRVLILKIAGPGEVLGLHACVSGTAHEFTAETVQPSQVAFVKSEDFLSLLRSDPAACWRAAHILSRQCRESYDFLRTMGQKRSASEKLAGFMLDLAFTWQSQSNGTGVHVGFTHEELGRAIGVSRETVWRILSKFRSAGVAVLQGSMLNIQNPEALRRLAGR